MLVEVAAWSGHERQHACTREHHANRAGAGAAAFYPKTPQVG